MIPKDLPTTDPLLFSFMMIVNTIKQNVHFNGKEHRDADKLPLFEYAVNSWRKEEVETPQGSCIYLKMDVLTALWTAKPKEEDCKSVFSKYPDGTTFEEAKHRTMTGGYRYEFENWRNGTFDQLDQIISGLTYKGEKRNGKKLNTYLSQIFGWTIQDNQVEYVYAGDDSGIFGVGAAFTLCTEKFFNCCVAIDNTKLTLDYFKKLGFNFDNC